MDSNIFVIYSNPNQQYINKLEYITSRSSNNMATTLANLVTKQYGFNDLNDNQTEIGKENLQHSAQLIGFHHQNKTATSDLSFAKLVPCEPKDACL